MTVTREDLDGGAVDFADIDAPGSPRIGPIHPGLTLRECLDDVGMTAHALALALHVPANRIAQILNGRRAITADTALRLARYYGTSADFWLGLQQGYDLEVTRERDGKRIEREVATRAA
jgi:addiction module HigA family antidote